MPNEFKKSVYLYGFALPSQYVDHKLPEIAVAGKSNVGKSSLINMLTNNNKMARVSSAPGKTRIINAFTINNEFILMDLPGYGFARVSEAEKARWGELIEAYLSKGDNLIHIFLLLDIRHQPTNEDYRMLNWLQYYQLPFSIIATKADKLSKAQQGRRISELAREIGVVPSTIFPVSSENRQGKQALLDRFAYVLEESKNPITDIDDIDELIDEK